MAILYTQIVHNGTVGTAFGPYKVGQAVGPIYISDVPRREDFSGILKQNGDDQYIDSGATKFMVQSGDLMLSAQHGILAKWASMGVLSLTFGVTGVSGF